MGHDNAGALAAYLDDGGSISSDGSMEEIERRVTTDVTTREIRTTTVRDEHGNVLSQSQVIFILFLLFFPGSFLFSIPVIYNDQKIHFTS